MDDLLPVQHLQAPQERVGEATDESEAEALEVVFFDELVQVHSENERRPKSCFPDHRAEPTCILKINARNSTFVRVSSGLFPATRNENKLRPV